MKRRLNLLAGFFVPLVIALWFWTASIAASPKNPDGKLAGTDSSGAQPGPNLILGRPTDQSITVSVLPTEDLEVFFEYGLKPGRYEGKTKPSRVQSVKPSELVINGLKPDAQYYYRIRYRRAGQGKYESGAEYTFRTQKPAGSTFVFDVQGDSHPERDGIQTAARMYDADLYRRTLHDVLQDRPDFYIMLGDDFSVDNLKQINSETVAQLYLNQRKFLAPLASSVPVFHVNGNHEQAARYLLDGTPNNPAVLSGRARDLYLPEPEPDRFYSGDKEPVELVGLLRDYYAWTWGDALFVMIDPYWHSPVQIGTDVGGARGNPRKAGARNWWGITMGDAQYQWFKHTLEQSNAKYKFVFTHHVLGTGRGGVDMADLYEWGGKNNKGEWEFDKQRPGWDLPVHQLMVKQGVTIFFQGHDHLFVHQERDGVVYQETPNPADPEYKAYNRDAYRSGEALPNSGHLRVTVSPAEVKVEYIRSYLPMDETPEHKDGEVAFSYVVTSKRPSTQ